MGTMTIPSELYSIMLNNHIANYVDKGHDLTSARYLATCDMTACYTTFEAEPSVFDKDYADKRNGDWTR